MEEDQAEKTAESSELHPELSGISIGESRVPIYALGNSIALIPFILFGWKSVFVYGLLMHLLGAFFFLKLLKYFQMESKWAVLLYLFFPSPVFLISPSERSQ